jgi:dipeptidyl aminopeptidase/acylaminoacyl peptidase
VALQVDLKGSGLLRAALRGTVNCSAQSIRGNAMTRRTGPFGSWNSPITADAIVAEAVSLAEPRLDGDAIYWLEGRPREKGRTVIVRAVPGSDAADITPPPFDARSQVHSYGGGAYAVHAGTVHFVHFADGQLYVLAPGNSPRKLTTSAGLFADICLDAGRNRLIVVREEHPGGDVVNAINSLVAVDLATGAETTLDSGWDFYSSPALNPDGTKLAWLSWRHPYMPWIWTHLHVAELDAAGTPMNRKTVAGGENISIVQPQWSPAGALFFISDATDFWNLYRWNGSAAEHVLARDAEFAAPHWQFAASNYAFVSAETMIYSFTRDGMWFLGTLDLRRLDARDHGTEFASISGLRAAGPTVVMRCATPSSAAAIATFDLRSGALNPVRHSIPPASYERFQRYFSVPQPIRFPTGGGETAYGFFYRPHNPDWQAPASERPPLIVKSHGGPTSATSAALELSLQFWTSRGFAVLDVNYRGSSGFGRKYREQLDGQWGVADVADCIAGAEFLASRGDVDPNKLIATGGSAGGYTTLCALTFHDAFAAGASYYGVSDLVALATDTHKFESHYLDWLIEPYRPGSALYRERSPIHFAERLSAPVVFLHGENDPVVPLDQAQRMFAALRARGIPSCLLVFEGEKHGFRQAEHIRRALESELLFYAINLLRVPLTS